MTNAIEEQPKDLKKIVKKNRLIQMPSALMLESIGEWQKERGVHLCEEYMLPIQFICKDVR